MNWISFWWYKYLVSKTDYGNFPSLEVIWCRIKGHPNGPIYYASYPATEPNMQCKDCGEEL